MADSVYKWLLPASHASLVVSSLKEAQEDHTSVPANARLIG